MSNYHWLIQLDSNNRTETMANGAEVCRFAEQPGQEARLGAAWYYFLALTTSVGLTVSLVSNVIIIYLFARRASLRKNPANIIGANLSLSDLLYCTQWPSIIYCSLTQSSWLLEDRRICQIFGFITVSTAGASILTVVAMSVERAFSIRYPLGAKKRLTERSSWFIIGSIWLISCSFSLVPIFGHFNRYTLDPSRTSCTLDYLSQRANYRCYTILLYVVYWLVPFVTMAVSYMLILWTVKKSSLTLRNADNGSPINGCNQKHLLGYLTGWTRCVTLCLAQYLGVSLSRSRTSDLEMEVLSRRQLIRSRQIERRASEGFILSSAGLSQQLATIGQNSRLFHIKLDSRKEKSFKRRIQSDSELGLGRVYSGCSAVVAIEDEVVIEPGKQTAPLVTHNRRIQFAENFACIEHEPTTTSKTTNSSESSQIQATTCQTDQATSGSSVIKTTRHNFRGSANSRSARSKLQLRLAIMSFYLIFLWLASWAPIASLAVMKALMRCHHTSPVSVFVACAMTKLGPAFDVFIYGVSHPRIKREFTKIMRRLFCLL